MGRPAREPYSEARERIRKFRAEPVPVREPVKPLFEYDPEKPLIIDRSIKKMRTAARKYREMERFSPSK